MSDDENQHIDTMQTDQPTDQQPSQQVEQIDQAEQIDTSSKLDTQDAPSGNDSPQFTVDTTAQEDSLSRSPDSRDINTTTEVSGDIEEPVKRLFVRPIRDDTTLQQVSDIFAPFGEITDMSIKHGYGFVEFENHEQASAAAAKLNGDETFGYSIMVEPAMARGKREDERKPVAAYRLEVSGPKDLFSWQDLKDLSRDRGVQAVFTKVVRDNTLGLIDVQNIEDRDKLIQMSGTEWKGGTLDIREDPRGPPQFPPRRGGFRGGRGGRGRGGFGGRGGRGGFRGGRGGFRGDRFDRNDRYNDRFDRNDRFSRENRYERQRSRSPNREPSW